MKKYSRKIIAIRGDTQGGHAGGLLSPETELPDVALNENGDTVIEGFHHPELRPVQKRLWEWHEGYIKSIQKLAGKDEIIFVEMGDLTQGNIFKDDLDVNNLNSQVAISYYNTLPWLRLKQVQKARFVKGTGVHVWGEGSTETLLTAKLKAEFPKKTIKINDHWILNVDGFWADIAHHGPGPGIRNWTRGNVFDLYLKSILRDDIESGGVVPNVVLRAHKHQYTVGYAKHQIKDKVWFLPGFITSPMCFIGAHAQKTENSPSFMGVGMLALEIVNGKLLDSYPFTNYIDLRTREIV